MEAVPGEVPSLLTALPEAPEPDASDLLVERAQRAGVVRQPIVGVVATQDVGVPALLLGHWRVHVPPALLAQHRQLAPQALALRLVLYDEPASRVNPQDSVPACPQRFWPGKTFTHKSSSASPNALRQVQQISHGRGRCFDLRSRATSLCSIGSHPFVPTCLFGRACHRPCRDAKRQLPAERRASRALSVWPSPGDGRSGVS